MKWHPASLMIVSWLVCVGLFVLLPFHIINRPLTFFGFAMLLASIMAFCMGAWARTPAIRQERPSTFVMPDFSRVDRLLTAASVMSMIVLLIEWRSNGSLGDAWNVRSDRATAILIGAESGSSLAFQLGILLSPTAYVILAKELIYYPKPRVARLVGLGFGPLVLSSLALGGRGPLLWGFTVLAFSLLTKRTLFKRPHAARELDPRTLFFGFGILVAALMALNYFVEVFIIRAGAAGAEGMFDAIADTWGVTFDGPMADAMKSTLGVGNTYLIFAFAWYLVQGIVISNVLFSSYGGAPQLGAYGIELVNAAVRRIDGSLISHVSFDLLDINVLGFLPSAFGTLYVDYWFFGLAVCAIWGNLAALVYKKVRTSSDGRWALVAPFIVQGVAFSVINTPFGLTNGFVTHSWILVVFLLARPGTARQSTSLSESVASP